MNSVWAGRVYTICRSGMKDIGEPAPTELLYDIIPNQMEMILPAYLANYILTAIRQQF